MSWAEKSVTWQESSGKHVTAQLVSLPLLLMVLHPDENHWLSVFIVCRLGLCWLARPCQATGQCLLLLSAWGSPSCPQTRPSYSNWYKVQRMPVSSWCGAASSCGFTPKLVRNWATEIFIYVFIYLLISDRTTVAWANKQTLSSALFRSELDCVCGIKKRKKNKWLDSTRCRAETANGWQHLVW